MIARRSHEGPGLSVGQAPGACRVCALLLTPKPGVWGEWVPSLAHGASSVCGVLNIQNLREVSSLNVCLHMLGEEFPRTESCPG